MVRNRFHDSDSLLDTIIPYTEGTGYQDFISVPREKIRTEPYMYGNGGGIVSAIEFEVSDDLYVEVKQSFFLFDGLALVGGFFALCVAVASYIFSLFMPWLMHLRIIQGLFRVDPSKGKKPKSQTKMNSRKNEDLLEDARNAMRRRVPLSNSVCDKVILGLESSIKWCTCKRTKFSRIVHEGMDQIRRDLDIFNHLRKLRLIQATVNALTTFNQRRLLLHQVETSFLLTPMAKARKEAAGKGKDGKSRKRRERPLAAKSSSDTESEEDFEFIEKALKRRELDEVEQRLLQGIIQKPPKNKKRFDHMTREEYRRKKLGADYSDEYDDEDDNDSFWEDSDYEQKVHDSTANKIIPGNESQETEADKKKGKLKRPDGISEKEWRRMTREQ